MSPRTSRAPGAQWTGSLRKDALLTQQTGVETPAGGTRRSEKAVRLGPGLCATFLHGSVRGLHGVPSALSWQLQPEPITVARGPRTVMADATNSHLWGQLGLQPRGWDKDSGPGNSALQAGPVGYTSSLPGVSSLLALTSLSRPHRMGPDAPGEKPASVVGLVKDSVGVW